MTNGTIVSLALAVGIVARHRPTTSNSNQVGSGTNESVHLVFCGWSAGPGRVLFEDGGGFRSATRVPTLWNADRVSRRTRRASLGDRRPSAGTPYTARAGADGYLAVDDGR